MAEKDRPNEVTIFLSNEEMAALQARADNAGTSVAEIAGRAVIESLSPTSTETLRLVTSNILGVEVFVMPPRP